MPSRVIALITMQGYRSRPGCRHGPAVYKTTSRNLTIRTATGPCAASLESHGIPRGLGKDGDPEDVERDTEERTTGARM